MSKKASKYSHPSHEEICLLAYKIFEKEGRPHGRSMEHWLQAESLLMVAPEELSQTGEKKSKKAQGESLVSQSLSNASKSTDVKKNSNVTSIGASSSFLRSANL
jgi:hypothetical protein